MRKSPKKRSIPFEFAFEALEAVHPYTKPMFGCTAILAGDEKIGKIPKRKRPKAKRR